MTKKAQKNPYPHAESPLILRCHRLMEAFAKSDEERDFYLDTVEGFLVFANLDKSEEELSLLEKEIKGNPERYHLIPKLTFYEQKKIMEGFVHEKVYDIDTKEKLMDIIQSKEAREHFLEFIYDHLIELEKWQQYYQERSRIRIIEWLRHLQIHFVFEEDLELSTMQIEKLKENLFEKKLPREHETGRKTLISKAKSYYSNEALNPRPKRGRPPKQVIKQELEPQISKDIYTTVPLTARPFLFTPDITSAADVTFSSRFEEGRALVAHSLAQEDDLETDNNIDQKLAQLRSLSSQWSHEGNGKALQPKVKEKKEAPKNEVSKPEKPAKKRIVTPTEKKEKVKAPKKSAEKTASVKEKPAKKRKIHLRRKKVK